MSLLTDNIDLLLRYNVCYAEGGLGDPSVYWTFWICLYVQGDELFGRGQTPIQTLIHSWGGAVAHLIPPFVLNTQP